MNKKIIGLICLTAVFFLFCNGRSSREAGQGEVSSGSGEAGQMETPPASDGSASQDNGDPAANVALVIGVNKYPHLAERFQLKGCVPDAKMMRQLLIERFQFDSTRVKLLTDEEGTRDNIIKTFEDFLIANATPEGQAVFYYSGHGSRMTDMNSDESDGMDETIIPHDSRDPAGRVTDISDDELQSLLTRLTAVCPNVTFIMDCCNSGSGVRGEAATPRQVPAAPRFSEPAAPASNVAGEGPAGFLPPDPNYVLISACRDREFAYEKDGHGALTYNLNTVMRQNPTATYREIMYKVTELVNAAHPSQHPQLEGKRRDAPIFGKLGVVEHFITVEKVQGNQVRLSAGEAHGVTEKSVYAIYKPGTTSQTQSDNLLGKAQVTKVSPFTCVAELQETSGEIPVNASAFEIAHHYGALQLPTLLDLDLAPQLKQRVKEALEQYEQRENLAKEVSRGESYEVKLRPDNDASHLVIERPDLTVLKQIPASQPNLGDTLTDVLTKVARRLNVFRLSNPNTQIKTAMTLKRWEKVEEDIEGNFAPVNPLPLEETEGGQRTLKVGDIIQMVITNKSNKPIHVYLLDLGTDGSVSLLYPGEGAQDSPLAPGDSIASFLMRVKPPEGLNAVKLIATTVPTDFTVLTQSGFRSVRSAATANSGLDSPIGQLLNLAWGGTRNAERIQPKPISDWGTDMLSFVIQKR